MIALRMMDDIIAGHVMYDASKAYIQPDLPTPALVYKSPRLVQISVKHADAAECGFQISTVIKFGTLKEPH